MRNSRALPFCSGDCDGAAKSLPCTALSHFIRLDSSLLVVLTWLDFVRECSSAVPLLALCWFICAQTHSSRSISPILFKLFVNLQTSQEYSSIDISTSRLNSIWNGTYSQQIRSLMGSLAVIAWFIVGAWHYSRFCHRWAVNALIEYWHSNWQTLSSMFVRNSLFFSSCIPFQMF